MHQDATRVAPGYLGAFQTPAVASVTVPRTGGDLWARAGEAGLAEEPRPPAPRPAAALPKKCWSFGDATLLLKTTRLMVAFPAPEGWWGL